MRTLLFMPMLVSSLAVASAASSNDCAPPLFYRSLPRDQGWYYGAGKGADPKEARRDAVRALGLQVTGDVGVWADSDVEKIAGPGRDRVEVSARVGELLPQSALLAGWEQDDFEHSSCSGLSYALVRVEKSRVREYLQGDAAFKQRLAQALSRRVDAVESGLARANESMTGLAGRLDALESQLNAVLAKMSRSEAPPESQAPYRNALAQVRAVKAQVDAEKPAADAAAKVEAIERIAEPLVELDRERALDAAIWNSDTTMVRALLKYGVDVNAYNALLLAASRGASDEILRLLVENGADLNSQRCFVVPDWWHGPSDPAYLAQIKNQCYGQTPLLEAAGKGANGAVAFLVKAGADRTLKDDSGKDVWAWFKILKTKHRDPARYALLRHPAKAEPIAPNPIQGQPLTDEEAAQIKQWETKIARMRR